MIDNKPVQLFTLFCSSALPYFYVVSVLVYLQILTVNNLIICDNFTWNLLLVLLFELSFCHVVIIFVILSGFVIENSNEYEVNENKIKLQSIKFSVEKVCVCICFFSVVVQRLNLS